MSSLIGVTNYIPGTEAKDYRALLETFKSKGWLTQAQQVRGLGALTESEGKKLESAFATLQLDQSDKAHKQALETIKNVLDEQVQRIKGRTQSNDPSKIRRYNPATGVIE